MANVDLDALIRKLAKQHRKSLVAAVKSQKDRFSALATKAKDPETKQRYKQLAKHALEEGAATVRRWEMSADNIADSYARSMRRAIEDSLPNKKEPSVSKAPPPAAKQASKKRKT